MSERCLIALGTASQVPTRCRNHNGYFLRWGKVGLLFDPGEGTQRQMTHYGVAASSIHHILITHLHGDHCLGLASLVQRLSLDRVAHPVHLFFPASGQRYIEHLLDASIYFRAAQIVEHPIHAPGVIWRESDFNLEAMPLDHPVETYGYRLVEPDRINLLPERLAALGLDGPRVGELKRRGSVVLGGRRVELAEVSRVRRGQRFAFVMDTRACDNAQYLAADCDAALFESTFLSSEAEQAQAYGHLSAADAARLARAANCRHLLLTHFSQRYQSSAPFLAEASTIHPRVSVLDDGDVIDLSLPAESSDKA